MPSNEEVVAGAICEFLKPLFARVAALETKTIEQAAELRVVKQALFNRDDEKHSSPTSEAPLPKSDPWRGPGQPKSVTRLRVA
jgi:hypothetical protein